MDVLLALICGVAALAVMLPCLACRPGTTQSRDRDRDRRLRWVERHPDQVNMGDLQAMMRAHELPEDEVLLVVDKARRRAIPATTMWRWVRVFDLHTLTMVIAADLSHEALLSHLDERTLPDLADLEVFAALNGLLTRDLVVPAPRRRGLALLRPAVGGAESAGPRDIAEPGGAEASAA